MADGWGVLVRYADDVVVLCRTEGEAVHALKVLTAMLADLGLEPGTPNAGGERRR
jgi:RNA-directed DNA polymerase